MTADRIYAINVSDAAFYVLNKYDDSLPAFESTQSMHYRKNIKFSNNGHYAQAKMFHEHLFDDC